MEMTISLGTGKKVDAEFKGFTFNTDQPLEAGGENTAPSPFDLFLASLGTCAGFYVLSFCQARSIPVSGIRLTMAADRNAETHMVETVAIAIHLPREFPEKYRDAVVKAAESCTVKKHLQKPPEIKVSYVQSEGLGLLDKPQ